MIAWKGEMDPAERLDFELDFRNGDDPVLQPGESIDSYSVAVTPEAAAYGLQIETDAPYAPDMDVSGERITIWLTVDIGEQSNPDFIDGLPLGVEFTIITDNTPPRTRQRTGLVTVKQL